MIYNDNKEVMDKAEIEQELIRISHEIIERNKEIDNLVLVGIRTRGIYIARRIATFIRQIKEIDIPVGVLDITLYRDDLRSNSDQPIIHKTDIPFSIMEKRVILVDDVLYTGRSIRAALDGLMSVGRPEFIQLAVLIDRGHRELPIQADYIGRNISTSKDEVIRVMLEEEEAIDRVLLQKRAKL
ncbi:MAG: bifunctional pyr operon transcriptional regulator/uracil phosphoribosyltransferase PyrR [Thermodesulfobacteriota bacterium]|nr:bifunctional pyr operon transcriptional regulator/uracil phosphoribosyltransferase PyrR [Thermodesulfobacteriota bacterium]